MNLKGINKTLEEHEKKLESIRSCVNSQKKLLDKANTESTEAQKKLQDREDELRTTTDFKELGLTNDKLRTAYINKQDDIKEFQKIIDDKEKESQKIRRALEDIENEYRDTRIIERLSIAILSFEET